MELGKTLDRVFADKPARPATKLEKSLIRLVDFLLLALFVQSMVLVTLL